MKQDIHPEYFPVVFTDGEHEVITFSTRKSRQTREINGVTHYILPVDISAHSHPFFTGKQKLVDSEGRVFRVRAEAGVGGAITIEAIEASRPML